MDRFRQCCEFACFPTMDQIHRERKAKLLKRQTKKRLRNTVFDLDRKAAQIDIPSFTVGCPSLPPPTSLLQRKTLQLRQQPTYQLVYSTCTGDTVPLLHSRPFQSHKRRHDLPFSQCHLNLLLPKSHPIERASPSNRAQRKSNESRPKPSKPDRRGSDVSKKDVVFKISTAELDSTNERPNLKETMGRKE